MKGWNEIIIEGLNECHSENGENCEGFLESRMKIFLAQTSQRIEKWTFNELKYVH